MKLHYFPGYGRAEACRMLLAHAKVPYENVHHTFESLPEFKTTGVLEFGQLPALEIDGKFYAQSIAILRFLGIKYGYYPEDAFEGWRVDSIIDSIQDLLSAYYKAAFAANEEEKKTNFGSFLEGTLPKWLACIEKRLKGNSSQKFISGEKMTIADFALANIAYSSFFNDANPGKDALAAVLESFPDLKAYFLGLGEELKEHLASRNPSPW